MVVKKCINFSIAMLACLSWSLHLVQGAPAGGQESAIQECPGQENSYLWRINTSPPIFLFGTMHVPYTTLWDYIPENAKIAFSSSEELCLELQLLDSDTLSELGQCRVLPDGQTVEGLLSEETVIRVTNYLDKIKELLPKWVQSGGSVFGGGSLSSEQLFGSVVGNWKRLRPIWLLLLLGSLTEQKTRLSQVPVIDTFLERAAQGLGKGIQAIEQPDDQCRPLNKLSVEQVELALRVQLDYLEMLVAQPDFNGPQSSLEKDIQSYRCGDFAYRVNHTPILPIPPLENITSTSPSLTEDELSMLRGTEEFLNKQMITKRNRKMSQQIEDLVHSDRNKTFFLGLGAGHYLSEKTSVITRLRRRGVQVEHIPYGTFINGSSLPDNIIELGDPSKVSGLLVISTPPPPPPPSNHVSISPERLAEIFGNHFDPSRAPPTLAPPTSPSQHSATLSQSRLAEIFGNRPARSASESQSMLASLVDFFFPKEQETEQLETRTTSGGNRSALTSISTLFLAVVVCLVNFEMSSMW